MLLPARLFGPRPGSMLAAMADLVLATLNAKYIHTGFGLRYLLANLGELQPRARLLEFDVHQRPVEIAEAILSHQPRIVGLGVYIWNVTPTTEVVALLKRLRPDLTVILGGPEVSHETAEQPIVSLADYVLTGEADLLFAEVCAQILTGHPPTAKLLAAPPPDLNQVRLPYDLYPASDLAHRIVYVEASRGCPFDCEFCLSALDSAVRTFPLPEVLNALQRVLDRGATHLKFVDRTFNLNPNTSRAILEFLLARCRPGHFFHFEMIPDRLSDALRDLLARFPPGTVQLELGVQTFNETVAERIQRRQNNTRIEETIRWLRAHTGVHLHADLIFGLPGETLESFAAGFDRLLALGPHEIQVGHLKHLRGAPIARHTAEWAMVYNPQPPYELLQNKLLDFATVQRLRRFARYWDLVGNSGNFVETTPRLWAAGESPFYAFLRWSDWLYARLGRTDAIALPRLMECLFEYLTNERGQNAAGVAESLARDYQRSGRSDVPTFLRPHLAQLMPMQGARPATALPKRQARLHPRQP